MTRGLLSLVILVFVVATSVSRAAAAEKVSGTVLELDAIGMRFQGAGTVPSGWTTIRMNNLDKMLHFAIVVRLPEGVTAHMYSNDLGVKFQRGYELLVQGRNEEAGAVFASMPAWIGQLVYMGGPGFTSGERTSESTVFLEPGNYVIECYIKSGDIFHSYSPDRNQLAMLHELTVTDAVSDTGEPIANATLTVSDSGYRLSDGELTAGENTIRVKFETQNRYPSFTGQDVHLMRVTADEDVEKALDWMDWRTPHGLQVPSPVEFIGGLNDMKQGSTGYFRVKLEPGNYAFVGETDGAAEKGLLLPFALP